ncbi:hypothetical protein HK098_006790 [Nowakowskiella sp. JEL0407]|nr:hypothetical protein HK098_006790 [Nowakowskiella sp. JEL0407]
MTRDFYQRGRYGSEDKSLLRSMHGNDRRTDHSHSPSPDGLSLSLPKPFLEDLQLKDSLKGLLDNNNGDVWLVANKSGDPDFGKKKSAHKLILSARSRVFKDMFEICTDSAIPPTETQEIPLPFSYSALDAILRYIYYAEVPRTDISWSLMIECIIASDYLHLPPALEDRFQERMITSLTTGSSISERTSPFAILKSLEAFTQVPLKMEPVWALISDLMLDGNRCVGMKLSWLTVVRFIKYGNVSFAIVKFRLLLDWLREHKCLGPVVVTSVKSFAKRGSESDQQQFGDSDHSTTSPTTTSTTITNSSSSSSNINDTVSESGSIASGYSSTTICPEKTTEKSIVHLEPHFPEFYQSFVWKDEDVDPTLTEQGKKCVAEVYQYLKLHTLAQKDLAEIERARIFSPQTMLGIYRRFVAYRVAKT